MKKLFLGLMLVVGVMGQTPPYNVQIAQQPLPPVTNVSVQYTGVAGTTSYWYSVIARYGVGNASPSTPFLVRVNPAGGGSVSISWGAPANPSGYGLTYDVVRLTTAQFQGGGACTNCLVSSASATNPVTDSFANLAGYQVNTYNPFPANVTLTLDNVNTSGVLLNALLNGTNIMFNNLNGCGILQGNLNLAVVTHNNNYGVQVGDCGKVIGVTGSSAWNWTIPQAGTNGFIEGWSVFILNAGTASLTLTTSAGLFVGNGASGSSITLGAGTDVEIVSVGLANWLVLGGNTGGGGGGATSANYDFRALCQNTISGTNFDIASAVGTAATTTTCDNNGADGAVSFASGATQHIQGHFFLKSTFVDPVKATIASWDTSATSGSATFGIAIQCVATTGVYSSSGYGAYTTWTASTAQGTAYHRNQTNTLSLTSGCGAGSTLYFDIELTSGNNTLGASANVNWVNFGVTE